MKLEIKASYILDEHWLDNMTKEEVIDFMQTWASNILTLRKLRGATLTTVKVAVVERETEKE